ncbi:MAG TPA: hypothetical protein VK082_03770 [Paenalcaligenes sp.]|nr:hypothetical protein [Paenalcaligenes sp.]
MNKKIMNQFIFCGVVLLWLSSQSVARTHSDCIEVLAPVTAFFQQHDDLARWQYFAVNQEHFAILEAVLHPQKLSQALEVLDINNEGALFMRMELQSLWIFKIKQCMYSLLADLKNEEQMRLQLTLYRDKPLISSSRFVNWLNFPLLHHFSDQQSGEEFYAFQWVQEDRKKFEQVVKEQLLASTAQVRSCWKYQLCAFEHVRERYLFSWLVLGRQHIMLLFRQPCDGGCDVGL